MTKPPILILLVAAVVCGASPAIAADRHHHAAKKPHAAKHEARAAADSDDPEPDVSGMQAIHFDCELGNKLTVYHSADNDQHIALDWKKRVHDMARVSTTTGAQRFENSKAGLVWIGIPAKSMLLDSKHGQQLANECKSPQQAAPKVAGGR